MTHPTLLLDDLESLGLLDETLVVMLGEFGRTPKINNKSGRDHWGPCFFGLFAGAGVQGGQVIGKSDAIGAYPVTTAGCHWLCQCLHDFSQTTN